MSAFTVTGGPCHWDIHLCFYVFFSPRWARRHLGNWTDSAGQKRLRSATRRYRRRLQEQFDEFFNPENDDGEWQLFEFPPCCSFHIDAEFKSPPANWSSLTSHEILSRAPDGCGLLVIDDLNLNEHPHVRPGGRRMLLDMSGDKETLAHEIGHILGLPDQYRTPDVPDLGVIGNNMTPEEEAAHEGHLMGRKKNGKREIQPHEISEIAANTGMTCDHEVCCPPKEKDKSVPESQQSRLMRSAPIFADSHGGAVAAFDYALSTLGRKKLKSLLDKQADKRKER